MKFQIVHRFQWKTGIGLRYVLPKKICYWLVKMETGCMVWSKTSSKYSIFHIIETYSHHTDCLADCGRWWNTSIRLSDLVRGIKGLFHCKIKQGVVCQAMSSPTHHGDIGNQISSIKWIFSIGPRTEKLFYAVRQRIFCPCFGTILCCHFEHLL